jgi:tol-pal system protein YbgF
LTGNNVKKALRPAIIILALALAWPQETRAQDGSNSRLTGIESTLALIQEELKNLTGRLEQSEFERARLARRIEVLEAELRAQANAAAPPTGPALSQSDAVAATEAASATTSRADPQTAPAAAEQLAVSTDDPPIEPLSAPDPEADGSQLLGTINRQALLGIEGQSSPPQRLDDSGQFPPTPGGLYNRGISHLERGEWDQAVAAFSQFGDRYPEHELANNAGYWLGESLFYSGDFASAAAQFARNYQTVGENGPRAEENLLKVGLSLAELGDNERACQTFEQLQTRYTSLASPIQQSLLRGKATAGCP